MTTTTTKQGEVTVITVAIVAVICGLIGGVLGKGVTTRSITVEVRAYAETNATNIITVSGQRVEVSGSGGVSIPVTAK